MKPNPAVTPERLSIANQALRGFTGFRTEVVAHYRMAEAIASVSTSAEDFCKFSAQSRAIFEAYENGTIVTLEVGGLEAAKLCL